MDGVKDSWAIRAVDGVVTIRELTCSRHYSQGPNKGTVARDLACQSLLQVEANLASLFSFLQAVQGKTRREGIVPNVISDWLRHLASIAVSPAHLHRPSLLFVVGIPYIVFVDARCGCSLLINFV